MRAAHHAALERLVFIDLLLTTQTGLHIGAGRSLEISASDLPVVKDGAGKPLLPGSSLRGILRTGVELIVKSLNLPPPRVNGSTAPDNFVEAWTKLGIVERLFGRVAERSGDFSYASRLHVSDGACVKLESPLELRDGVAISRETRTAAGGAKFDLEVVPAGTCFSARLRFTNPEDYELGLVAHALWMLNEGMLHLGGASARGLGWIGVQCGEPRDLDIRQVVSRPSRPATIEYGHVEKRLSKALADLERFVAEAGDHAPSDGRQRDV